MKKKINIAIIGGGFSSEREVSIKTSRQIAQALPKSKYNVFLLEITKQRQWLLREKPFFLNKVVRSKKSKELALSESHITRRNIFKENNINVAFLALHGRFGEDGRIQAIFEMLQIPYTGSGVLASAWAMNKIKCLEAVSNAGIQTPKYLAVNENLRKDIPLLKKQIKNIIGFPCVVKPNESGSSIGISVVEKESDLLFALKKAHKEDNTIIIEQYIKGRELTCAVLGNTGQGELKILPPVEIITHDEKFFDYHAKYFSKTVEEICPAPITKSLATKLQNLSKNVHELLGCDGLTRSDFIYSEKEKKLYFLEINTIPGQTEVSLSPKEAVAAGMSFPQFLEEQIKLALKKHAKKS